MVQVQHLTFRQHALNDAGSTAPNVHRNPLEMTRITNISFLKDVDHHLGAQYPSEV